MKKFGYVIAALGAIAIAAPSIASAEEMVVRQGDHHRFGARAEFREHRDFREHREHRDHGWRGHHDSMMVRHRHHED